MEYICVRKKQRRNVVHIALFIGENSVGTERMLQSFIKRKGDKKNEKRETVYLKIIFQRTKMFQDSYINFLYFQRLVFTVPDTWRKVIVHQFGETWVQHISEVTYSYSFKYLYTGILQKNVKVRQPKYVNLLLIII